MATTLCEVLTKRSVDRGAVDEQKRSMIASVKASQAGASREADARPLSMSSGRDRSAEQK
jgi:hypothetical protein